jgi:release factor glutamine methyltransferase
MRLRDSYSLAHAQGVPRLDVQWLLAHLLQRPRAWLVAHDDEPLAEAQAERLRAMIARRAAGEPLVYVTGETEFRGLRLAVTPDVLVPRPETEVLVEWALAHLPAQAAVAVADLGTGSGAIALALKRERPLARIVASDASEAALCVARENARALGLDVRFLCGDWWAPFAGQRLGLAVSNPPYVAGADPHLDALDHEPWMALTPGGDGLAALREVVRGAPACLQRGAWLLLEHGHDQADAVRDLLADAGFGAVQTRLDLAGLPRCTGAEWKGAT